MFVVLQDSIKNYFQDLGATSKTEDLWFSDGKGGHVLRTTDYITDLREFLTDLIAEHGFTRPVLSLSMDSGQGQFLFGGDLGDLEGKF